MNPMWNCPNDECPPTDLDPIRNMQTPDDAVSGELLMCQVCSTVGRPEEFMVTVAPAE